MSDWMTQGRRKFWDKDYPGAIACYDQALLLKPDHVTAYVERAEAKIASRDAAGAIADLTQAIKLQPDRPRVYLERGDARIQAGDFEGAVADLDWSLVQEPKLLDALHSRGAAEFLRGDYIEALADLNAYINQVPDWWSAYTFRARTKIMMGNFDGALPDLEQAIMLKRDGPDACTYFFRGWVKDRKGMGAAAIHDYTEAIKAAPNYPPAYLGRAVALTTQGEIAKAIEDYAQMTALPGANPFYPQLHRCVLLQFSHRTDATNDLAQALPGWTAGWPKTIGLYLTSRLSEADFLAAAEKGTPESTPGQRCEACYFAGMTHLTAGDEPAARKFFRQCLDTDQADFIEFRLAGAELKRLEKNRPAR